MRKREAERIRGKVHACAQVHQLEVSPARLVLRLPMVVRHTITEASPLANWRTGQAGIAADASSEIVVVVSPCPFTLNACHIVMALLHALDGINKS